jgi:hypothetical protein
MWFRLGEIIVQTPERSWATRNPHESCPNNVSALGCSGEDVRGKLSWLGFDLDVGHGKKSYATTFIAIQAARKIKERLGEPTEIRLSKGGLGVHVRHMMDDRSHEQKEAGRIAKEIANELRIRADPTSLSRQAHWLWSRKRSPEGFKLVDPAL